MTDRKDDRGRPAGGFSLVELLVVMGLIAVMAAIAIPAIANYIRNYRIRGATQQVAGEVQRARTQAIMKNVNLGVVFVTLSPTTYQWAVEDDQTGTGAGRTSARQAVSAVLADPAQASPVFQLPLGVQFAQACPAGVPTSGAWEPGFRFNRLGAWCDPGIATCPAFGTGQNLVFNISSGGGNAAYPDGSFVCVQDTRSNLRRTVAVRSGGRILAQP